MRRKKKAVHKSNNNDDKRLNGVLKKLHSQPVTGVEEANLFCDDGNVIHFVSPKVQACIGARTFVISGRAETKRTFILPDVSRRVCLAALLWVCDDALAVRLVGLPACLLACAVLVTFFLVVHGARGVVESDRLLCVFSDQPQPWRRCSPASSTSWARRTVV